MSSVAEETETSRSRYLPVGTERDIMQQLAEHPRFEWRPSMTDAETGTTVLKAKGLCVTLWDPVRDESIEISLGAFKGFNPRPASNPSTTGVLCAWLVELDGGFQRFGGKGWLAHAHGKHIFPHSCPSFAAAVALAILHCFDMELVNQRIVDEGEELRTLRGDSDE